MPSPPDAAPRDPPAQRVVCLVNGIFGSQLGGGDIYFAHMARAAVEAGFKPHFFGGHALRDFLQAQGLPLTLTLTDGGKRALGDATSLGGQCRLLLDFARRFWGTLRRLGQIQASDIVYSMSDYWFDSIPLLLCRARVKIMYLGMMAPTLGQVLTRGRGDVTGSRLASLYYWASQQFSLRCFRWCQRKKFTYGHPEMRAYLRRFGYRESELVFVANGMDTEAARQAPEQLKQFDLAWTGRVHPQKGIDDLLETLAHLARRLDNFKAVIIGKSQAVLEPIVAARGISAHVHFAGLVSEAEKFRLLKASRVFAMPSRYESWGIVVGEALASGIPVVAYDLPCYRPVFGDFVRYVPPFSLPGFQEAVESEIQSCRRGENRLAAMDLEGLRTSLSWKSAQASFVSMLRQAPAAEPGQR